MPTSELLDQMVTSAPSASFLEPSTISPWIEGTKIRYAWSASTLGDFKTCPKLYYYKKILGYQEGEESVHLRFGSEYHLALQTFDELRMKGYEYEDALRETLHDVLVSTWEWNTDHKYKNRPNLVRTVLWYLFQFENDPAATWKLADGKPATEINFRFSLDFGPRYRRGEIKYVLYGILDRIVEFNDEIFVMDRKTTKSAPSQWYFTQYEPDNQMSFYTLASQVVFNSPIKGVMIDAAQVLQELSRYGRAITYRNRDQLEEWLNDLHYWLDMAEDCAVKDHWPMNDKACNSYRSEESNSIGCPFREICSKSPRVRDKFLANDFKKEAA